MTESSSVHRYFAVSSPGLESVLRDELGELGILAESTPGGVSFRGPLDWLWRCAASSRIAESIRLRLKPFHATDFASLERGFARLPWHAYLSPQQLLDVSVSCSESRLYHTAAIEERLRRVLLTSFHGRPAPQTGQPSAVTQRVFVRLVRNEVAVSIDATGDRLHRRGYRTHVGVAPIRETLAAAACRLLAKSAERPITQLWDPCCGSGTLLCEWLHIAAGVLPAFATDCERNYAFEHWPIHPRQAFLDWKQALKQTHASATMSAETRGFGSDKSSRALDAARHNLLRAGVLDRCTLVPSDFRVAAADIPKGAAVITNLPYGIRLKTAPTHASPFAALDEMLRERSDLRPALAISSERPPQRPHNPWSAAARFANGGLAVSAWVLT